MTQKIKTIKAESDKEHRLSMKYLIKWIALKFKSLTLRDTVKR
jgi:hypothetical protein